MMANVVSVFNLENARIAELTLVAIFDMNVQL